MSADVIHFGIYRQFKKIVKLKGPCDRPFHKKRYVITNPADHHNVCVICGVKVSMVHHPSMKNPKWYGK